MSNKVRLGGMALPNGVLVHGPTSWACAIRTDDGELRVAAGEPARMILQHAAEVDADFVVLGTTGQTGLALSLLGSVAEAVTRGAQCSVLVVKLLEG